MLRGLLSGGSAQDLIPEIIRLLYMIPAVLISLTLHEVSHGYMALRCGDPTAQMAGRLSLNPLRHLNLYGTLCMLLLGIGWANPVPVNPRNYRHYRRDDILVSSAGILMNLFLFILATFFSVVCVRLMFTDQYLERLAEDGARTLLQASLYNGDGLADYMESWTGYGLLNHAWLQYVLRFLGIFSSVNVSLAVFNFLPVPPLDGYHLFNDILFRGRLRMTPQVLRIAAAALLIVNLLTNWIGYLIFYVSRGLQGALLWVLLPLFGMA